MGQFELARGIAIKRRMRAIMNVRKPKKKGGIGSNRGPAITDTDIS